VKTRQTALAILAALSASFTLADDFKTINGKEYKNVTVSRVEPDGIVLRTKSGIAKVYFIELPKEVQERFHYDPQKVREQGKAKGSKADESKESAQVTQGEELQVKVMQVLPDGILAYGSVAHGQAFTGRQSGGQPRSGSYNTVYGEEKAIFLQGFRDGVAEGEVFQVQAHADGTYTYQDASGASRTLEKWVFTKLIKRLE
jgi:hypothetical protein